jgi:hypothetical protein
MSDPDPLDRAVERAGARFIASLALVAFAAALVWFAWVDAPITDAAMDCIAVAGLACAIATVAALLGFSLTLHSSGQVVSAQASAATTGALTEAAMAPAIAAAPGDVAASKRARRIARLRRVAVLALAAQLVLLIFACTVTLNLRGTGDDDSDADTAQRTSV